MFLITSIRKYLFSDEFNREYGLTRTELLLIRKHYYLSFVERKPLPIALSCLDSRVSPVGFADRLRGMISCFAYAKAVGVPFRIEHIAPFDLSDYFVPNRYDWQVKDGEKSFNLLYANPVYFIENFKDQRSMRMFTLNKKRQHHLYANSDYIAEVNDRYNKNYKFNELFSELFKISEMLEELVNKQSLQKENGYVSVSFRFMQLMGDFKDAYGEVLSENDREELLKKSLIVVSELHKKEKKKVLVTSDSQSFIDSVSKLDFVLLVEGEIGHIGYSCNDSVTKKMFLDFYMISQAQHVYLAYSGKMYKSNFAKTAAMSTNAPYSEIAF